MPISTGYYDAEFSPWVQGMRRIGSMIAMQPQMQADARARQQQADLMAARSQTEGAQQGKLRAETMAIEQDTGGRNKLGEALRRLTSNPNDPAALADAFEGTAQALRHDPEGTSKALGTLLGQMKALGGDVAGAANVTDPVAMEKNRGDNASKENIASRRLIPVQPGGALVDPRNPGAAVFQNPSAASQAQAEYEETSMTYPEVPAVEAKPAVPARTEGSMWWKKTIPEQPATPAVPGTPARTVKTRRRLGDAAAVAANQTQDPNDSELPSEDPGGPEEQGEPTPAASAPVAVGPTKKLTPDIAMSYLTKYKNRADAEKAAKQDGYSW